MGMITAYSILSTFEAWITGYRVEHLQLGLQQGICQALALLPVLVNRIFTAVDRGGSVLLIAITVAVVLEPSTGDAFRKLVLRLAGAGVAGGIGLLLLFFAVGHHTYTYDQYHKALAAWVVPSTAVFGFVFTTNQQRFVRAREFWSVALLTLPITLVPAVRADPSTFYTGACYRMMDIVIGILLAAVVSFLVFPVRARVLLEKKMASTLIQLGDLAVWLVGQASVPPAGDGGAMPGHSGTDTGCLYTDDGLRVRLAPLLDTTNSLAFDISSMWHLLEAANAELTVMPPHRFPTEQYRHLLHSSHISVGILYSLINAMQSGDISLEVCQRHIGDISEAGVRLSAGFTALGSLIRPQKAKKGRKKVALLGRWRSKLTSAGSSAMPGLGHAAGSGSSGAGADGAGVEQLQGKAVPLVADVEAADVASAIEAVDDPFAGLEDEGVEAGGAAPQPVVSLSDSQILSAQQMARHLSQHARHSAKSSGSDGDPVEWPASGVGANSVPPPLHSAAIGGGLDGNGGAGAAKPPPDARPSLGMGSLAAVSSREQRRDWVLRKLQALVDSVHQLEAGAVRERQEKRGGEGMASFMLLTHALINLTRQCGACFTALDAQRGAALHAYFQQARQRAHLQL